MWILVRIALRQAPGPRVSQFPGTVAGAWVGHAGDEWSCLFAQSRRRTVCGMATGAGLDQVGASQPRTPIVHQRPLVGRRARIGPGRSNRIPIASRILHSRSRSTTPCSDAQPRRAAGSWPAAVNLLSRSRIKKRNRSAWASRSMSRLRACWVTRAPVGWAVIPARCTRRALCSIFQTVEAATW